MKMFKKFLIAAFAFIVTTTAVSAASYKVGPYVRIGAGFPDNLNIGVGYYLTNTFSLGAEATSVNMFGGYGAVADARVYFGETALRPFGDIKAGYGVIGKNISYHNVYGFNGSAMAGVNWRRIDLGIGGTYDPWNNIIPFMNISYTIQFGRKK